MELLKSLNEFAGFFSLLAAIAAIVIPFIIYRIERKNARQDALDKLDAINSNSRFPMPQDLKGFYTEKSYLEKKIEK